MQTFLNVIRFIINLKTDVTSKNILDNLVDFVHTKINFGLISDQSWFAN